jgi:release factor glutamine methyltransferase
LNEQGLAANDVSGVRKYLEKKLASSHGEREAKSIVAILFHHFFGWNKTDLSSKSQDRLSESEILKLHMATKEVLSGKPVQHITGSVFFYGNEFKVNHHVLIPRPETEELVDVIVKSFNHPNPIILDVGTGSGCIAISLKKAIKQSEVYAIDISSEALEVAKLNAELNNCEIHFLCDDVLHSSWNKPLDVLVSNPPYIPIREAELLDKNVLDYEPHSALFVPNNDPLIFYKALILLAEKYLRVDGIIALECHELYADQVAELCKLPLFKKVELRQDMQGKNRMVLGFR